MWVTAALCHVEYPCHHGWGMVPFRQQENDMSCELNNAELDLVSGGDIRRSQIIPGYKEPTVLYDDGINIRTTGLFHSNVGYDSPFTPIPA
jgi:hypothetical protein